MTRVTARSQVGRALSQHSLRSPEVARRIVAHSGLAPPTTIYEIGAGSGLLTEVLAARAGRVVAVEHDRAAWGLLRSRFAGNRKVETVFGDFLDVPLPAKGKYAVAGNIPFAQTSAIMRRLLDAPNPPSRCVLVMQREAALRWSGDTREGEVSVLAKTRFTFKVLLALRRQDFVPPPRVACVVLGITRKPCADIRERDAEQFRAFVRRGFGAGRTSLRKNLGAWIDTQRFGEFVARRQLPVGIAPGDLTYEEWLELFRCVSTRGPQAARMAGAGSRG